MSSLACRAVAKAMASNHSTRTAKAACCSETGARGSRALRTRSIMRSVALPVMRTSMPSRQQSCEVRPPTAEHSEGEQERKHFARHLLGMVPVDMSAHRTEHDHRDDGRACRGSPSGQQQDCRSGLERAYQDAEPDGEVPNGERAGPAAFVRELRNPLAREDVDQEQRWHPKRDVRPRDLLLHGASVMVAAGRSRLGGE